LKAETENQYANAASGEMAGADSMRDDTQERKPVRLVIADVDGTLVTHDKVLTQRAIDSVFRLRDAGIQFAVTSGRPPRGMAMLIGPLKLNEPLAAFNGGVVIQPDLTTVLGQNFLPASVVKQTVQLILEHQI
jgi:HAD superfamily hydrolase (TIGR01484 family)